jgi:hypothetical protein
MPFRKMLIANRDRASHRAAFELDIRLSLRFPPMTRLP